MYNYFFRAMTVRNRVAAAATRQRRPVGGIGQGRARSRPLANTSCSKPSAKETLPRWNWPNTYPRGRKWPSRSSTRLSLRRAPYRNSSGRWVDILHWLPYL